MKNRDWTAIASEYITTNISLTQLSEKHDIPLRTIKERSKRENWVEKRQRHCTDRVQSLSRSAIKNEQRRLDRLQGAAEDLAELIGEDIQKLREVQEKQSILLDTDVKMVKDLVTALKGVADVMRDIYAIPTIKESIEQEKWEKEKERLEDTEGGGDGVIILADVIEREEEADADIGGDTEAEADHMGPAAEAD